MLDVNGTREIEVGGRKWALKPLPFAVMLERQAAERQALMALRRVAKQDGDRLVSAGDDAAFEAALSRKITEDTRSMGEALRWGLRAYAVGDHGEDVSVDGRAYRVLSVDAVATLVSWGGETMERVAREIVSTNALTPGDLMGFLQPPGT